MTTGSPLSEEKEITPPAVPCKACEGGERERDLQPNTSCPRRCLMQASSRIAWFFALFKV